MFRCKKCGALNNVRSGAKGNPVCGRCKAPLDVSGAPQPVNGAELARTIASSPVPVLVDFWAPWCGPCHAVAPVVEQFARETAGRIIVLKLDTEAEPAAAGSYGIQGIPTFILFKNGREAGRRSGAMPKQALVGWLNEVEPGLFGGGQQAAR
jgi:thioredoxin 2